MLCYKPDSVKAKGPKSLTNDDHSSRPAIACRLKRTYPGARAGRTSRNSNTSPLPLPYLILLRAEFGCFHSSNSLQSSLATLEISALDILSVPLFLGGESSFKDPQPEGRYPLRCPMESGLSSRQTFES